MTEKSGIEKLSSDNNLESYLVETREFFALIRKLDSHPEVHRVRQDEYRSMYCAASKSRNLDLLDKCLSGFFGEATKPAGKATPLSLRLNPAVKAMGGINKNQALYTRKVSTGMYYAAIWPWTRKPVNLTINLGFYGEGLSEKDYSSLEDIVETKVLKENSEKIPENGIGGKLHGISLGAFLQMSALENTSCTLKVKSANKTGLIYLLNGQLINAKTNGMNGESAAYRIIGWDEAVISIQPATADIKKEIHLPLMHILMEGLKKKDEQAYNGKEEIDVAGDDLSLSDFDSSEKQIESDSEASIKAAIEEISLKAKSGKKKLKLVYIITALIIILVGTGYLFMKKRSREVQIKNELTMIMDADHDTHYKLKLLQAFIAKYDKNELAVTAKEKIDDITSGLEDKAYNEAISQGDKLGRNLKYNEAIEAYKKYKIAYPEGKYSEKITFRISEAERKLSEDGDYNSALRRAESSGTERIFVYADFLEKHPDGKYSNEIKTLIASMNEEFYLFQNKRIDKSEIKEDWETCIKFCNEYIRFFPDNDRTAELSVKKKIFEKRLNEKNTFEIFVKDSPDGEVNLEILKDRYEEYLNAYPTSYLTKKVKTEISAIDDRLMKTRLKSEEMRIAGMMGDASERFIINDDGTFIDKKTDLMWCTLDSEFILSKCVNFEDAEVFIKNLKTGGYTDWRLPTDEELVSLYKKQPVFPSSMLTWYWTSNTYKHYSGYWKTIVNVVDTKKETSWEQQQKDSYNCGSVRAVRDPGN
ncbi:MAG: DUF1566 domain-containing protein [Desulfobacterales bacterium]|nr:DUF1566 domain-containing protein [Desulfobacterales bacterium]